MRDACRPYDARMTHADLQALFDAQYQASRAQVDVPLLVRRERLLRMRKLLDEHGPTLAAAVQAIRGQLAGPRDPKARKPAKGKKAEERK